MADQRDVRVNPEERRIKTTWYAWVWDHTPQVVIGVGVAVLGPPYAAWRTGYFRSALARKAVDRLGQPLPWYSYPAIDVLRDWNVEGLKVLEWGAGQSTLWWASRGAQVLSLEANRTWFQKVSRRVPPNADVRLISSVAEGAAIGSEHGPFDIIVVDGEPYDRVEAARISIDLLQPDGTLIVDNTNHPLKYASDPMLREAGFLRIDYYGPTPIRIKRQCTSIYGRPECRFFHPAQPPRLWA